MSKRNEKQSYNKKIPTLKIITVAIQLIDFFSAIDSISVDTASIIRAIIKVVLILLNLY